MQHLVRGVREALATQAWYAALALALTLPDTCASFEGRPGRARYVQWANTFVVRYFTADNGVAYLTADELYLLRCAFLHQGDLAPQARSPLAADDSTAMFEVLNRVNLYVSDLGLIPARGMTSAPPATAPSRTTSYSTTVHEFCESICKAVEDWLAGAPQDVLKAVAEMPRIVHLSADFEHTPL